MLASSPLLAASVASPVDACAALRQAKSIGFSDVERSDELFRQAAEIAVSVGLQARDREQIPVDFQDDAWLIFGYLEGCGSDEGSPSAT